MHRSLKSSLVRNLALDLIGRCPHLALQPSGRTLVIGSSRQRFDLLFRHLGIRCHLLVALHTQPLTTRHVSRLGNQVIHWRDHHTAPGDSAPVGLLLGVTPRQSTAAYITSGMDSTEFDHRYLDALPSTQWLEQILQTHLQNWQQPPPASS